MSGNCRIIATLGPSSYGLAPELADAGASAFRLNSSHMPPEALTRVAASVRHALPDRPVIVDLQGAKMRLGDFAERSLKAGERLRLALDSSGGAVPVPHPEFYASVVAGETLRCDDSRLVFRVAAAGEESMEVTALADGILRPRKGINVVEHPVLLPDLPERDAACMRAVTGLDPVSFALSFMTDGHEADWIRRRAPASEVIGKVERREAAEKVGAVAQAVDALWICRGDLGAQMGAAGMARWVAALDPSAAGCPVYMAGQVVEHLTRNREPTRTEVCHLFDLLARGYAGFVLSDETAIGADPVHAVRTLHALVRSFGLALD